MIWVHKEQATLENAQSHLYKGTRQNMRVTKHNNANQTFWIFYFLCVFGFLTQKQVMIDQKEKHSKLLKKKKKICQNTLEWLQGKQPNIVTTNRKNWCMDMF